MSVCVDVLYSTTSCFSSLVGCIFNELFNCCLFLVSCCRWCCFHNYYFLCFILYIFLICTQINSNETRKSCSFFVLWQKKILQGGMAQWVEWPSCNRRVASLIPACRAHVPEQDTEPLTAPDGSWVFRHQCVNVCVTGWMWSMNQWMIQV